MDNRLFWQPRARGVRARHCTSKASEEAGTSIDATEEVLRDRCPELEDREAVEVDSVHEEVLQVEYEG